VKRQDHGACVVVESCVSLVFSLLPGDANVCYFGVILSFHCVPRLRGVWRRAFKAGEMGEERRVLTLISMLYNEQSKFKVVRTQDAWSRSTWRFTRPWFINLPNGVADPAFPSCPVGRSPCECNGSQKRPDETPPKKSICELSCILHYSNEALRQPRGAEVDQSIAQPRMSTNVRPCVPKKPVCRKKYIIWGLKSPPYKYIKL
jgi:hypothetical protein